jgi:WD40 repeat protein
MYQAVGNEMKLQNMRFLSGGNDLSIHHWKETGIKMWDIKGFIMHKDPIQVLRFYNDPILKKKIVFSGSSDASVKVWDISNH